MQQFWNKELRNSLRKSDATSVSSVFDSHAGLHFINISRILHWMHRDAIADVFIKNL